MRKAVWVFSGHGSQWAGMGAPLLDEPEFAAVIDSLEPVILAEAGFSPRAALAEGHLEGVDRIQTMIFSVQAGLVALLRSRGAQPAAVIGHSVGEIAAAVTAGTLSLHDSARLICRRSRLLRRVAGKGAMIMAALPFEEAERRLRAHPGAVAAIFSAPASTVIAGSPEAVNKVADDWRGEGISIFRVASDVAFHSPHMDPLLADLKAAAADLDHRPRAIPVYSTTLRDPRGEFAAGPGYWAANLRNPVRLAAAVTAAVEDGHRTFIEVSPHPVVAQSIFQTLAGLGVPDGVVNGTLRRNKPQMPALESVLATLTDRVAA